MNPTLRRMLISGLQDGSVVPYLGPGVLTEVKQGKTGLPMPATSRL